MANQFGEKIRQLRETNKLLQRQVASEMEIDTPMLSKIERGERRAKREQVKFLSKLFKVNNDELLTLWLADQLVDVVQNETVALKAMQVAEDEVKYKSRRK